MDPEVKDEGMDIDAGVETIAEGLGLGIEHEEKPIEDVEVDPAIEAEAVVDTPVVRPPPKSWAKETHDLWTKIPAEAQAQIEHRERQMHEGLEGYKADSGFGKAMREIVSPYKALLTSQGVDEGKAVQILMDAHYKLSTLEPAQRAQYFARIANQYSVDLSQIQPTQQQQVDPALKAHTDRLDRLESSLTAREQAQFNEARVRTSNEVSSFADAKDDKGNLVHPYFNDVSDDIIVHIQAGADLNTAYDKAVYANPVTRAKEIARLQTEAQAKLREKSKQEAEAARKARGSNVRSRDTGRAPTEPLGKMEDTMRETLKEINSRTH